MNLNQVIILIAAVSVGYVALASWNSNLYFSKPILNDVSCKKNQIKEPLWQEQSAFAQDVGKLLAYVFKSGYLCTLGEAWRSHEQAEIYAHEGKGIVHSQHCRRLAIDLNLYTKEGEYLKDDVHYKKLGTYWESLNKKNRWGGTFKQDDADHFERNI